MNITAAQFPPERAPVGDVVRHQRRTLAPSSKSSAEDRHRALIALRQWESEGELCASLHQDLHQISKLKVQLNSEIW